MNIVGQQNMVGLTATMEGYPTQTVGANNILGTNNVNLPRRSDGNFAFLYPDYGYTLGYGENLFNLNILGSDNLNGFVTDGYLEPNHGNQVIVGNNNFNSNMNTGDALRGGNGGLKKPKVRSVDDNVILGSNNFFGEFKNQNSYDGTYDQYPFLSFNNSIVIGNRAYGDYRGMKNFIAPGSGDLSNQRRQFSRNIILNPSGSQGVRLRERYENAPGASYGYPDRTDYNIIVGGRSGAYGSLHASNTQNTITLGNGIFGQNNSNDGYNVNAFSNLDKNVVIGNQACPQHGINGSDITTQNNTIVGHEAQVMGSTGLNNCTVIGANASASATNASNEITLGDASISALRCNVTSITSLSDARDKTNIEPISNASAFIKDLKPVKFDWDRRDGVKAKEHDMGFLAQDLDDAQSKHGIQEHLDIVYKSNPEALEASYGKLLPILVQALKEQQEEIEKLKSTTN